MIMENIPVNSNPNDLLLALLRANKVAGNTKDIYHLLY
jgi:hypothetical protein